MESLRQSVVTAAMEVEHQVPNTICRDSHALILFVCPVFAQHQIDYVLQKHANVEISFESSEVSTSGFIVVFSLTPRTAWFQKSTFARTVILAVICVVIFCPNVSVMGFDFISATN